MKLYATMLSTLIMTTSMHGMNDDINKLELGSPKSTQDFDMRQATKEFKHASANIRAALERRERNRRIAQYLEAACSCPWNTYEYIFDKLVAATLDKEKQD